MSKIGRNDPCPCGSGKKYKKCCLSQNHSKKQSFIPPPGFTAVYTALDKLSNSVITLIKQNKLDEAEEVCHKLQSEYPDLIDGIERLAQVYEARGEKRKAAEYYRKAADFAKSMEGFDQESIDWYLSEAKRMDSKV